MVKRILLPLLVITVFSACSNNKAQEQALLDSLEHTHDKVMGDDGMIMKAKANLKQLAVKVPALKDSVTYLTKKLDDNDNLMMDWMNKFNPDFTGKQHDQIMQYLRTQEKQVMGIDSQMKKAVATANDFYVKHNGK
jgi:hypothetical protein